MCVACVYVASSTTPPQVDSAPSGPPLVIESMTHLAKLTYEEYNIRLSAMQQSQVKGWEGVAGEATIWGTL